MICQMHKNGENVQVAFFNSPFPHSPSPGVMIALFVRKEEHDGAGDRDFLESVINCPADVLFRPWD